MVAEARARWLGCTCHFYRKPAASTHPCCVCTFAGGSSGGGIGAVGWKRTAGDPSKEGEDPNAPTMRPEYVATDVWDSD